MLEALRANRTRQAVSRTFTLRAPVGGLNMRDALAHMPASDAIICDNFFPEANYLILRKGYSSHSTGVGTGVIQTLMTYHARNGSEKLFAGANAKIYDCTTAGAATVSYSTAITVNKWQYTNFSNTAGTHIIAVNGTDAPLKYSGTAWSAASLTGSISSINDLINVWQHKERMWFCEENSLDLWYLATQAISGTLTKLPLGGVFSKGGQIVAGGTLSFDAGAGVDDYLVAITDNGEAVVYSGITPASDFALVGVFDVGRPVGRRCMVKVGGDLIITTTQGAVHLSAMIRNDRAKANQVAITAKISEGFNIAVRDYGTNFGWQSIVYPSGRWALFNVPEVEGVSQTQFVQNIVTGAWCTFSNMNANCWGLLNDNIYFGGNGGVVYRADFSDLDVAEAVEGELKTAFNYCGTSSNKMFTMMRPFILSPGTSDITTGIDVDFNNDAPTNLFSEGLTSPSLWDVATWNVDYWQAPELVVRKWQTVGKIGACAAAHILVSSEDGPAKINDIDLLLQPAQGTVL